MTARTSKWDQEGQRLRENADPDTDEWFERVMAEQAAELERAKEPTGWELLDWAPILAGEAKPTQPEQWTRADGQPILYRGKVHAFVGEPESGKSWAALAAAVQEVEQGGVVLYLDFEDSEWAILERLRCMGLPDADIGARFGYVRPDQPFSLEAREVLVAILGATQPTLAILDGVTEVMALMGLNPYDNPDVAKFWAALPRLLARAGVTVVLIDHVVKDKETRGRWAIGGQHKLAAIDGASFAFEPVLPFGRGKEGKARVNITKDRPGHLRQYANGAGTIGELRIQSWPDERVDAELCPPVAGDGSFRPTVLMERVSRYVEDHPGLSKNSVKVGVTGDDKVIRLALELLIAEGFVAVERQGQMHCLLPLIPYRKDIETDEPF